MSNKRPACVDEALSTGRCPMCGDFLKCIASGIDCWIQCACFPDSNIVVRHGQAVGGDVTPGELIFTSKLIRGIVWSQMAPEFARQITQESDE